MDKDKVDNSTDIEKIEEVGFKIDDGNIGMNDIEPKMFNICKIILDWDNL